jgi:hypothetical protein
MTFRLMISLWLLLIIFIGPKIALSAQATNRQFSIDDLASSYEAGDGGALDAILNRGNEAIPILLRRSRDVQANVREAALDLLSRIDLQDDALINRDDVIRALTDAISGSEPDDKVVAEALRSLNWIDPKKGTPELSAGLFRQLQRGHERAITILGRLGDPRVRDALEPYATVEGRIGDLARQAMAGLGDKVYLDEILADLNTRGLRRSQAIGKLAYVGDKSTVRSLALLLYDPGSPEPEFGSKDVVFYAPYRYEAAGALARIIDNPPVNKRTLHLIEQDIVTWRAWWEAHQNEYP